MRVVGMPQTPDFLQLGMSTLFVRDFIKTQTVALLLKVKLRTDHSNVIAKGLIAGRIDLACSFESTGNDPATRRLSDQFVC